MTAALTSIETRLATTAATLASGAAVDLAGLEDEIRAMCALAGALDAAERQPALARLEGLLRVLETVESALTAARAP